MGELSMFVVKKQATQKYYFQITQNIYIFVSSYTYPDLKYGDCVRATGNVLKDSEGALYIDVGDTLSYCE